ncbi:MAG: DUF2029 domain-containing protein, partial [Deltaproteobacteria bacterium]|nr:DUF2029 domain-containing protein [Deltaproteobacteria bacterium]
IWIVANALVLVAATLAALRVREALGLPLPPRALALALVLWSFPVVFELERANFDLITLFVVLAAAPLLRRGARVPDLLAGALLAVGPWVKLYPGVLGLLLVGLRRRWALAGFAAAGIAIGAATPRETIRSFEVLRIAVHRVHGSTLKLPLSTWTHSVTAALTKLAQAVPEPALRTKLLALPLGALAVALVVASLVPLALRVFRHPAPERLYLPLACLLLAAGSTAPEIANDYSLAFLPIAAVAVVTTRDPLPVRALLAGGAIVLQPFALPIPAAAVLSLKLGALVGVGLAIGRRLAELPRAPGSDAP